MSKRGRIISTVCLFLNDENIVVIFFINEKGEESHFWVIISFNDGISFTAFLNNHMILVEIEDKFFLVIIFLSELVLEVWNGKRMNYLNLHLNIRVIITSINNWITLINAYFKSFNENYHSWLDFKNTYWKVITTSCEKFVIPLYGIDAAAMAHLSR